MTIIWHDLKIHVHGWRQRMLAEALLRKKVISHTEIHDALYGADPDGGPENIHCAVRTIVHRLRPRLAKLGYQIRSDAGRGWRLVRT